MIQSCPVYRTCRQPNVCTLGRCVGWPGVIDTHQRVAGKGDTCTYCGQLGHRAHACPARKDAAEDAR